MAVLHSSRAEHGCGVLKGVLRPKGVSQAHRTRTRTVYLPSDRRNHDRAQARPALSALKSPVGLCPCDRCPHAAMCCDEQLACRAFAQFVRGVQWRSTVRKPTHKRYVQLFASDACGAPSC